MGGLLGGRGGGGKGYVGGPPLKLLGGPSPPLFHIEIEGKCGWIIGGEGGRGQRVCWWPPPLKLLGGPPPPPHPTPFFEDNSSTHYYLAILPKLIK